VGLTRPWVISSTTTTGATTGAYATASQGDRAVAVVWPADAQHLFGLDDLLRPADVTAVPIQNLNHGGTAVVVKKVVETAVDRADRCAGGWQKCIGSK
jgi:hypothetical protein